MIDLPGLMKHNVKNTMYFHYDRKKFQKTFSEVYEDTLRVLKYIEAKGLEKEDRIGSCSSNCYELIVLDIACTLGGFQLVPIHKSQIQKELMGLIEEFKIKLFFIEAGLSVQNQEDVVIELNELEQVVKMKDSPIAYLQTTHMFSPEEDFTTVFTSGTTGTSKGFIIKFRSLEHFISLCSEKFRIHKDDKVILFLPLSQFSSRTFLYAAICNQLDFVLTNAERLIEALRIYKPTILQGVPFFYNKLYEAFTSAIYSHPLKNISFAAYKYLLRKLLPEKLNKKIQKKLFKQIHDFWGGRMRILMTGAAPSRKEVLTFFSIVGCPIYEVYGLVETGLITMNYPGCVRFGSVGKILPYIKYKFDEHNQLLVKSDYFWGKEYINCSKEENKATFGEDGYVLTGDLGFVDKDGFLYLRGRQKDVIVLLNGNNIHPVSLENSLNGSSLIRQCAVFGNGKPFLVAVIVRENSSVTKNQIHDEIRKANSLIKGKGEIKNFMVAGEAFNVENKMMNENMKINRNNIYQKYKSEIEALFK